MFPFVLSRFSVESTALRLITALGSSEVQPQFTRFLSDPKTVLSAESEELNRALILTLARATHVTGTVNMRPTVTNTDEFKCAVFLLTIKGVTCRKDTFHLFRKKQVF